MGSERVRLTALYGGLLLLAGGLLTGMVYLLVKEGLYSTISVAVNGAVPAKRLDELSSSTPAPFVSPYPLPTWQDAQPASPGPLPPGANRGMTVTSRVSDAVESAALERLLTVSLLVLAAYAVLSVILAWWVAGRVLRPVAVITETARRLSGENLLGTASGRST
nr:MULTISPECIES: hypothetical protein [unclassified Streptomyces]